jgi:F-type H+-transporting ATPase subunit gamma
MASLKEVKTRIASVKSTKKITAAMKMVSSAKLKKAQTAIENIAPYQDRLNRILNNFLATETDFHSAYAEVRPLKRLAIVVFSSNSSLAGAFNSNVIKKLNEVYDENKNLGAGNIVIFPVGKKVYEASLKLKATISGAYNQLAEKPNFDGMSEITGELMTSFLKKEFDKVIVIYHHLKSTAVQQLFVEDFLPIRFDQKEKEAEEKTTVTSDYIVEPSKREVLEALLPKALRTKLYACLLDSNASEHGARTVAMQIATDNAEDLIKDLTVLYNKTRQQTITSELLDIVGGIAALQSQ